MGDDDTPSERILAVLRSSKKPLKASAIADALNCRTIDVIRELRVMEKDGRLKAETIRTWRHYSTV